MLNFSNLTPAEVLRYAAIEGVPERMNDEICELVESIGDWATELPKTKQAAYKVIRDNPLTGI